MKIKTLTTSIAILSQIAFQLNAQGIFEKVTDTSNPIVSFTPTGGYTGASWIDFNNDGLLDLFTNSEFLFQNLGNGQFSQINQTMHGIDSAKQPGDLHDGHTWGDYDNDGNIDVYLANRASALFRNNGNGSFSKVEGPMSTDVNAWAAAFGDYDNDGFLDLMATHPCGFIGQCHSNYLFKGNGSGSFVAIENDVTAEFDAYTVGSWSDFDLDGDIDLFVGSGEVSQLSPDNIYINKLFETGEATLEKSDCPMVCTDQRDGQNWNWIDYDNDGDLDGFVTNYSKSNDFYRNDGGTFHKLTQTDIDSDLTSLVNGQWLTNVWGDFNNDGFLDVYLGNDGSIDYLYTNDGDGTFTKQTEAFSYAGGSRGASAGDFDNDGDLDLFISAAGPAGKGLYRNKGNSNNWLGFKLVGKNANRSAIGAIVRIKATINGQAQWQMREISAQNSFCGSNDLRINFGLADASIVDSLIIRWPNGALEEFAGVNVNQYCEIIETEGSSCSVTSDLFEPEAEEWVSIYPNPVANGKFGIVFSKNFEQNVSVSVFDVTGKKVFENNFSEILDNQILIDLNEKNHGIFFVKIETSGWVFTKTFTLAR